MHPFQILAEPVRRRIVEILAVGEHSAGNLAEVIAIEFGITASAVSHHLTILRANNWVDFRYEWTNRFYWLTEDGLTALYNEVDRIKYLRVRRYGWRERNDPQPYHAFPFVPRPHPRATPGGSTRGLRGRRAPDPWGPQSGPVPKRTLPSGDMED